MNPTVTEIVSTPKGLSLLFKVSMWWRITYGILRIIVGVTFLRLVGQSFSDVIYVIMSHEIGGNMGDLVLEKLYQICMSHDVTVSFFIAGYFIFWGTVDVVLSLCLLRHYREAFPITMALIVLFIIYGIFRLTYTHSIVLLGVILVDIVILYLINTEYQRLKDTKN